MNEEWIDMPDYPGYAVSNLGRVMNTKLDFKILTLFRNNRGIINVYMSCGKKQVCRSVAILVAKHWLEPHPDRHYDTPTHKDGDRSNCRVENLVWRPRWYAVRYHKEVNDPTREIYFRYLIRCEETGEIFKNSREVSRAYGALEWDIINNITRPRILYMYPHNFEIVK